ncbi:MAG: hypothetical protein GWO24_34705, partial [Akkermansiaceae bacterium]|nr:hypothetical protein [Akkermansiaceae bacterium]
MVMTKEYLTFTSHSLNLPPMNRRHFLAAGSATALTTLPTIARADHHQNATSRPPHTGPNRIGVSSYSFWAFHREKL